MTVYYVGKGGNDSNDGLTWATRKLTLNGAEDIPVAAGDTVYVGPGTYREELNCDISGAAGSPITYIGDYSGEHTDGVGGVVRITGSDDDLTATRNHCIRNSLKDYRVFRGFSVGLTTSHCIYLNAADEIELDEIFFGQTNSNGVCIYEDCVNVTIKNSYVDCGVQGYNSGIFFLSIAGQSDRGCVVENCIIMGCTYGVRIDRMGGITVRNCTFKSAGYAIRVNASLPAGQVATMNNCILFGCQSGASAVTLGDLVEDYNNIAGCTTARANVAVGANSNTTPPLFDSRWFFETVK